MIRETVDEEQQQEEGEQDTSEEEEDDEEASEYRTCLTDRFLGPIPCHGERLTDNMLARFLRYTAHEEHTLQHDDWIELDDNLLCRLRTSLEELVQLVRTSTKEGRARFEMMISGQHTWLRATHGKWYRERARRRAGMS